MSDEDAAPDPFADDPFDGAEKPPPSDVGEAPDPFADDPFESKAKAQAEAVEKAKRARAERGRPKTEPELPAVKVEPKRAKVTLPPPAQIASGTHSGDTSISGAPLPAQKPQALAVVTAVCLLVVLGVTVGGVLYLNAVDRQEEKQAFLRYAKRHDPQASLLAYERLPADVRADPEVLGLKEQLEARLRGESARREAEDRLEGLARLADDAARVAACTEAIEADPGFAAAYVQRARSRARLALRAASPEAALATVLAESVADLDAALDAEAARPDALLLQAQFSLRLGKEEEARQLLTSAGKSTGAVGSLARGWSKLLARNPRGARESFSAASRSKIRWIANEGRIGEARARLELGDKAELKALVEQARREDAEAADPHWLLSEVLSSSAPRDARTHLDDALRRDPFHPRALALRASLSDDAEAARADARRSLDLDPSGALPHLVLARFLAQAGNHEQALTHARRAVELARYPQDQVEARFMQIPLLVALRQRTPLDVPQALKLLDEALTIDPEHQEARIVRARLRAEQGDRAGALDDLGRALAEQASQPLEAYLLRARLLLEERPAPIPQVLSCLENVFSQEAEHPEGHLLQARAYVIAARYADALRALGKTGAFQPERATLLRGDAHYGLGQWEQAGAAYAAFLAKIKNGPDVERARKRKAECEAKASGSGSDF